MARSPRRPTPRPVLSTEIALVDLLRPLDRPERVGEKQWEHIVEGLLAAYGWTWTRVQVMRVKDRFLTGTTSRGYPDITAVRPPYVLWLELKTGLPGGAVTDPDQARWIRRFQACGGNVLAFIVRPQDAAHVVAVLADPTPYARGSTVGPERTLGSPL